MTKTAAAEIATAEVAITIVDQVKAFVMTDVSVEVKTAIVRGEVISTVVGYNVKLVYSNVVRPLAKPQGYSSSML
jgi:hypothetical protein